jgi:hypothetical protein
MDSGLAAARRPGMTGKIRRHCEERSDRSNPDRFPGDRLDCFASLAMTEELSRSGTGPDKKIFTHFVDRIFTTFIQAPFTNAFDVIEPGNDVACVCRAGNAD